MTKSRYRKLDEATAYTGKVYGYWTVIGTEFTRDKFNEKHILCKCICGTEANPRITNLIDGKTKSCGCVNKNDKYKIENVIEKKFGRLTVIGTEFDRRDGYSKILAKCDCGTEKYVDVRAIVDGVISTCGPNCGLKRIVPEEFAGKRFGYWTVIGIELRHNKHNGPSVLCKCDCGTERYMYLKRLKDVRDSCGICYNGHTAESMTGNVYGYWTVIGTEFVKRGTTKYILCKCKCGTEKLVKAHILFNNVSVSCGCFKPHIIDGTHIQVIEHYAQEHKSNNYSGRIGVYYISKKNTYMAGIRFKSKFYYLGQFKKFENACKVRELAEDMLFRSSVDYYKEWTKRAESDPEWAEQNPIKIIVEGKDTDNFKVSFSPNLLEFE